MRQSLVRERLYQKYIEPTKRKREDSVGIEIEIPIVNLRKEAVDFAVVHSVTEKFIRDFHFQVTGRDDEGGIYAASEGSTGDILSYDCSYNNLELSLGKECQLYTLYQRFCRYYVYLQAEFAKFHYALTGMGVNPYRIYNHNIPIPTGRYRMLFHHLNSYKNYSLPMYFHPYPEYGTFSSASQVQLDVDYDDLLATLDVFSRLEPIKALLFSNSLLLGEKEELLCCRDMFWANSTHGINPHNIGMFACRFEEMDELLAYIESTSIYCAERGGRYINFPPVNIMEYFQRSSVCGEYFTQGGYQQIEFRPEIEDIQYLRTFKFEDLTFRGTIEFRSVCCQPIQDCMTVAAFHLGLKGRLYELEELLDQDYVIYHHGYTASELRNMFIRSELPSFVDEAAVYRLAKDIVDLAKEGLTDRGYGEEALLNPLYERLQARMNPAKRMLNLRRQGRDMEEILLEYGRID